MNKKVKVSIRAFAGLRDTLPSEFTLKLKAGSQIKDLFKKLSEKFPKFKEKIDTSSKGVPTNYIILKNGRNIVHLDKRNTNIEGGDVISMFPPIGGGKRGKGELYGKHIFKNISKKSQNDNKKSYE